MDPRFNGFWDSIDGFGCSDHNLLNGELSFMDYPSLPYDPNLSNYAPSWSTSPERSPLSEDSEFSDTVLKYISHILMEEDIEDQPCMFQDTLTFQAAEKSFHQALDGKNPASPIESSFSAESRDDDVMGSICNYSGDSTFLFHDPLALQTTEKSFDRDVGRKDQFSQNQPLFCTESPDDNISVSSSDYGCNSSSSTSMMNAVDRLHPGDPREYNKQNMFPFPPSGNYVFQATSVSKLQSKFSSGNSSGNGIAGSPVSQIPVPDIFSDSESVLQFKRGMEEANKFLPKGNQLIIDFGSNSFFPKLKEKAPKAVKAERNEEYASHRLKGKKNHERDDTDLEEERSNKQSAVFIDENELSEMFDVLLCFPVAGSAPPVCTTNKALHNGENKSVQQNGQSNGSNSGKAGVQNQGNSKKLVDLGTLLIQCAGNVRSDDRKTANEILKQVRQHASPFGDGSQRLAHYFANCLEARMVGTGSQIYTELAPKRTSTADILKAYQVYMSACPFNKLAIIFANHMILKFAEGAKTLHIIDFGILYGFQWPALIHYLSRRPGGPPKLRITGIDLPLRGFRPAKRVQETGRRLAKYCERFEVPFEYTAIAKKWETIRIEDIKINSNEVLAVNSLFRFKNLLDETVVENSPRDAVLKLIRQLNPSIFVHAITNGSYSAPFFVTRFREALFHYSALFDMLDANLPREDRMRLMFEKEFYGREAVNAVACEGPERVERPETYKQWQVRHVRAGFKQLPLDRGLMKKLRGKLDTGYHNDFVLDEDGNWMLQGWKGRIVHASSSWVPA